MNPPWLRYGPEFPPKTIEYFHYALECDFPIIEALTQNLVQNFFWTGEDYNAMAYFFYNKCLIEFVMNPILNTNWNVISQSQTEFKAKRGRTTLWIQILSEGVAEFCGAMITIGPDCETPSLLYVELDRNLPISIYNKPHAQYDEARFTQVDIVDPSKVVFLTRKHIDSEISTALAQFFEQYRDIFNK